MGNEREALIQEILSLSEESAQIIGSLTGKPKISPLPGKSNLFNMKTSDLIDLKHRIRNYTGALKHLLLKNQVEGF